MKHSRINFRVIILNQSITKMAQKLVKSLFGFFFGGGGGVSIPKSTFYYVLWILINC